MTAASSDSSAIPFMAQGLLVWIQHSVRKRGVHSDSSAIVTGLGLHGKDRNTGYGSSALARSVDCQCGSPSAGAVSAAAWSSSPAGVVAVASGSFDTHQTALHIEGNFCRITFKWITPSTTAPCIKVKRVTGRYLYPVRFGFHPFVFTIGTNHKFIAALTGQTTIHAPRVGQPTIIMNRDFTRFQELITHR